MSGGRAGLLTRLAATRTLHTVCRWLNRQRGQPLLELAELIGWEKGHATHTKRLSLRRAGCGPGMCRYHPVRALKMTRH